MVNSCTRCGKERITGKTWKTKIGNSIITHTLTLCPDKACQKLVDQALLDKKVKNDLILEERAKAKLARIKVAALNS